VSQDVLVGVNITCDDAVIFRDIITLWNFFNSRNNKNTLSGNQKQFGKQSVGKYKNIYRTEKQEDK
jgi:hypothetical protein